MIVISVVVMSKVYIREKMCASSLILTRVTVGRLTMNSDGTRMVVDEYGRRYRVIGNEIGAGPEGRITFTGEKTGRLRAVPPTPRGDPVSGPRRL